MAHRKSKARKEIQALNGKELVSKIKDIQDHLFQLRMQFKTGQLASTAMLGLARGELARAKMYLTKVTQQGSAK
jgi:ribosomal protein L29